VTRIKNKNARLLRANDSDEKLAFASRIEREKFVEAFWLLKEGLDRVCVAISQFVFVSPLV